MQHLNEDSLKAGDLEYLVDPIFEIDSYKSKMGDDKDVIVLAFTVESNDPAKDLVSFIEKGYQYVLDADMTPGELSDGKYRVFVELERDETAINSIVEILYGLEKLTKIAEFKFRYHKSFDSKEANEKQLKKLIPTSPEEYESQIEAAKLESYQHFFANSLVESINMSNDIIKFKKIYAQPLTLKYINSGTTKQVIESIPDRISVHYQDMADVMFLTKYLGNYNITKFGNKFMFENKGYAVVLEKI